MKNIIVLDVETTGLFCPYDEILQLSIIDYNGNTLMNEFIKPSRRKKWRDAQKIHGISPEDVKDCKTAKHIKNDLKQILETADTIIGYNLDFDLAFISKLCDLPDCNYFDVMLEFAEIYGEWSEYYNDYKWQKLTKCARYYEYGFKAHDSLEDCKATLHCYKKMKEISE